MSNTTSSTKVLKAPSFAYIVLNAKTRELHNYDVSSLPLMRNEGFTMEHFYSHLFENHAIRTPLYHQFLCILICSNEVLFKLLMSVCAQIGYLMFKGVTDETVAYLERASSAIDPQTGQRLLVLELRFTEMQDARFYVPPTISFSDECHPHVEYARQLLLGSMRNSYREKLGLNWKLINVGKTYCSLPDFPTNKQVAATLQIPIDTLKTYYKNIVNIAAGFSPIFRGSSPRSIEFLYRETLFGV